MGTSREQQGLSRRELIKRGLRTGAYAAPVVLASVVVAPVAAQTVSRPATATPLPTATPIPGTPTLTVNTGTTPQSATVNTAFATPLSVTVRDGSGNPVSGAVVTFTINAAGAGGTFAGGATTVTATTNASGVATAPALTANGTTGTFTVTATTPSVATPVTFTLTNTPITLTANAGTTPQNATVNTAFATPLSVTVRDASGNPVSGAVVTFTINAAGAGGTFAGGATTVTATTNASGVATAPALTANGTTGTFTVTATAPGAVAPVTFTLTNTPAVTQPVPFFQDFILGGGINPGGTIGQLAPNTTFNVFYRPSNSITFTPAGTVTTDAFGIGFITIPITNLDATMVSSIQLVAVVPGQTPSIDPTLDAVSFTSTIITLFARPTGSPRPAPSILGLIIQEQTTLATITDIVDVGVFNSTANTAFDIYIQPNGTGAFTRVTTVTTNAQGNITTVVPVTLMSAALATTFVLNVVPAGAAPTAAVLTTTLTTPATVRTLPNGLRLAAVPRTATDVPGAGLNP